jgi:micrococcal nuclease
VEVRSTTLGLVVAVAVVVSACTTEVGGSGSSSDESNVEEADVTTTTISTRFTSPSATLPTSAADLVWELVEIIDGDTIVVEGSDGEQTVRLIGINAPEVDECFHDQATDGMRFFADVNVVRLVPDRSEIDQFGRLVRYVETLEGIDIGAELVRAGFAVSRRYEPDTSRSDAYDVLQDEAVAARRGLWAPDACDSGSADDGAATDTGDATIAVLINADAPGDDNVNLNEEWVRFTNRGDDDVDLTGWLVADESSSHRYTFDDLTLAPGDSVTLFTGCGDDDDTERHWCNRDSAVWNNSGDTVFLRDLDGNIVVSETYRN